MGASSSKEYQHLHCGGQFDRYHETIDFSFFEIWEDRVTAKRYKAFKVDQHLIMKEHSLQICNFRKINRLYIVGVFGIHREQESICSVSAQTHLLVEHLHYKISALQRLFSLKEALTVVQAALCGYQILSYLFGPLNTSENMIWLTDLGIPKVWANQDVSSNQPSLIAKGKQEGADSNEILWSLQWRYTKSIGSIFETIEGRMMESYPSKLKDTFSRLKNYDQALEAIENYCKSNNIELQQRISLNNSIDNRPMLGNIPADSSYLMHEQQTLSLRQKISTDKHGLHSLRAHQATKNNNSVHLINYLNIIKRQEVKKDYNKPAQTTVIDRPRAREYFSVNINDSHQKHHKSRIIIHHKQPNVKMPIIKFSFKAKNESAISRGQYINADKIEYEQPFQMKGNHIKRDDQQLQSDDIKQMKGWLQMQERESEQRMREQRNQSIEHLQNGELQELITFNHIPNNNLQKQIHSSINHQTKKDHMSLQIIEHSMAVKAIKIQRIEAYVRNQYQEYLASSTKARNHAEAIMANKNGHSIQDYPSSESVDFKEWQKQDESVGSSIKKLKAFLNKENTQSLLTNQQQKVPLDANNQWQRKRPGVKQKRLEETEQCRNRKEVNSCLNGPTMKVDTHLKRERVKYDDCNIEERYNKYVLKRGAEGLNSSLKSAKIKQLARQCGYGSKQKEIDEAMQFEMRVAFGLMKRKRLFQLFKKQ